MVVRRRRPTLKPVLVDSTGRATAELDALLASSGSGGTGPAGPTGPTGPAGPAGPTGPAGADGVAPAWTSLTANLSAGAGVFDYEQTVTDAAVSGASKIALMLDPGADTDENQPEFLALEEMTAYPATGSFRLVMNFRELHSGPIKLFYQVN